jgi:hypothetical protein
MKLETVNYYLRKIGLVLTLFTERTENKVMHSFTLEKASAYDARIPNAKENKVTDQET